jgi:hypothetical protein
MKRKLAVLLAAMLAGATSMVLTPSPAAATDVCAGTGTADVTPGLLYPVTANSGPQARLLIGDSTQHTFSFGFTTGTCAPNLTKSTVSPFATGVLLGYCGHSFGFGTTWNGHSFAWVSVGGTLVITGHLIGVVNAVPNPTIAGNSCIHVGTTADLATAGALTFIINGAVLLVHCSSLTTVDQLTPLVTTGVLPSPAAHVTVDIGHHVWASVCVPTALTH